jgi:dihydrofolate reductase
MGRVIAQQWVSVDGLVAGPNGEVDIFEAVADFADSETHNLALLETVEEILLGRRTFEAFRDYWPTADDEPMAESINRIRKTVCSSRLTDASWGEFAPARVVGDGVAHAHERRGATGDTIVWGSIDLMGSLLAAGALDELELFVAPVVVGSGRRLLGEDTPVARLQLTESEAWQSGVVRLRYALAAA